MQDRTLTLLGPSKTESMSGYRIGAAVGPAALIDRMADLLYVSAIRCPAYAQHLLARWIADDEDYVAARIVEYQELRDLAVRRLELMPGVDVRTPGGTSYVFPAFPGLDADDVMLASELKRNGLIISPGFQFGLGAQRHIRICFAQETDNLVRALDIVEKTVSGLGSP
jgi:aspartate/methionine/tyrosine aminotransferase